MVVMKMEMHKDWTKNEYCGSFLHYKDSFFRGSSIASSSFKWSSRMQKWPICVRKENDHLMSIVVPLWWLLWVLLNRIVQLGSKEV